MAGQGRRSRSLLRIVDPETGDPATRRDRTLEVRGMCTGLLRGASAEHTGRPSPPRATSPPVI